jgi:predicted nucleotidyltransferase
MLPLIEHHRAEIEALCRRYSVRRLELFGSAARGDYKPAISDLDFMVEFTDYAVPGIADQWFGLQEGLEGLFGVKVELVSARTARNPYFLETINRDKVLLFAA